MTTDPTSAALPAAMTKVSFGSAHLLVDHMPESTARALLEAAAASGAVRLDTAPLYGHGGSEPLVASVAAEFQALWVTTKVGLEPSSPPPRWRSTLGTLARRLPPAVGHRLRSLLGRDTAASQADGPSGRFGSDAVKRSVERSLSRLGRIDRLLLHEVHPDDVTDELLEMLSRYQRQGDIAALGVATGNAVTHDALRRSHGLFSVAHVSVDPLGAAIPDLTTLPAVQLVGHGALGAGGRTLAHVRRRLERDRPLADRWTHAVAASAFADGDGLAGALLARAAQLGPGELLVATRHRQRVLSTIRAASGAMPLPAAVKSLLDEALGTSHIGTALAAYGLRDSG